MRRLIRGVVCGWLIAIQHFPKPEISTGHSSLFGIIMTQKQLTTTEFCGMCCSQPCNCPDMPMPTNRATPPVVLPVMSQVVTKGNASEVRSTDTGEPVAEKDDKAPGLINWLSFAATNLPDGTLLYTIQPVVQQCEPSAWLMELNGERHATLYEPSDLATHWNISPLYTTPPSVESLMQELSDSEHDVQRLLDLVGKLDEEREAAIEATKEKAAKVCEDIGFDDNGYGCAASIRGMK